jgi:uncharacterized SAM-binding protein YcdF (DUF218 family)
VLTHEVPERFDDPASGRPRRRRGRIAGIAALVILVTFAAATARLFVWPARGMPARVDAIVMTAGRGDRLPTAEALARQHRAGVLVISHGWTGYGHDRRCAMQIPQVRVICFSPRPGTTQGEAEFAGRLAKQYHWHSIALVTNTPQDSRARLRMERCYSGHLYVVTARMPFYYWPYEIAYEWAATIKALTINRAC